TLGGGCGKFGICSGALIERKLVLTAGHCIQNTNDPFAFWLPTMKFNFTDGFRYANGIPSVVGGVTVHGEDCFSKDLALVLLQRDATDAELLQPADVYTSGDFVDRFFTEQSFFAQPQVVAFGARQAAKCKFFPGGDLADCLIAVRKQGFIDEPLEVEE